MNANIWRESYCWGVLPMLVAISFLTGCETTQKSPRVAVELKSSPSVIVQSVHVRTTKKGVMVSGAVCRGLGYTGAHRSHLDVDVFAPEGHPLQHVKTRYIPLPIPRSHRIPRHSDYAVELFDVPPGSLIRVSHHLASMARCENSEN